MSDFHILLTVLMAGFGFMGALLLIIWNRIERLDAKIEDKSGKLDAKLEEKTGKLDAKLEEKTTKLDAKLEEKIGKLDTRLYKLEIDMVEIKTVLRMIESSLSSHGHCLFNQAKPEQKAQ
jgi:septal ring factor EnvC (AmiA/AmiB activator)